LLLYIIIFKVFICYINIIFICLQNTFKCIILQTILLNSNKMKTQLHDSCATYDQESDQIGQYTKILKLTTRKGQHIAKWMVSIAMSLFLTQTSQAVNTYYLTESGAKNAQDPKSWNTSSTGDGTAATDFTTDGDLFLIPQGISASITSDFIFGNYDSDNAVTLNVFGTLTIKDGTQLIIKHGSTSKNTIINIEEQGSVILNGAGTSQLYGSLNLQASKANIQFNILKGATLKTINTNGISSGDGTCSINNTNLTMNLSSDANYEFNGAIQSTKGLPSIVNNLTFSGTGAKTLSTATQVNGIFSIENGSNINTYTGAINYGNAAALQYNAGTSARTTASEWKTPFIATGGVIIKGTGTITLNVSKQLGNNTSIPLNINSGATLATNSLRLAFHGDFINNGTLIAGNSQVIIGGSAPTQSLGSLTTTGAINVSNTTGIVTLTGNVSASSLSITSNASLAVSATKALTISGTLTNNGKLLLKSNAEGTATLLDNGMTGTGIYNMEQYLTGSGDTAPSGRGWYVSSPVNNATRNVFTGKGNTLWNWSEENHAYSTITEGSAILTPKEGYVTRAGSSGIVTFSGNSFNSGSYSNTALTRTGTTETNRGYHLIGNPYPSYLDWNGASKTNILPTIWYRTYNGTEMVFDTYNGIAGTNNSGNGAVNQFIPPIQAVWVLVDGDGNTGSIGFDNNLRSHQSGNFLRKANSSDIPLLRLEVTNGTNKDETIVLFNNSASNDLDNMDSPKISNNLSSVPELYTLAGSQQLAINSLNNYNIEKVMALGFKTGLSGCFTLKASEIGRFEPGTNIILTDKLLNTQQNLTEKPIYRFTSEATNTSGRFTLTFNRVPISTTSTITAPDFAVFNKSGGTIQVQFTDRKYEGTTITLYTASGQALFTKSAEEASTIICTNMPKGFYLVEVNQKGYKNLKKIIINQ
jgi:hypothetical protein